MSWRWTWSSVTLDEFGSCEVHSLRVAWAATVIAEKAVPGMPTRCEAVVPLVNPPISRSRIQAWIVPTATPDWPCDRSSSAMMLHPLSHWSSG